MSIFGPLGSPLIEGFPNIESTSDYKVRSIGMNNLEEFLNGEYPKETIIARDLFDFWQLKQEERKKLLSYIDQKHQHIRRVATPFGDIKMLCLEEQSPILQKLLEKQRPTFILPVYNKFCVQGNIYSAEDWVTLQFCALLKQQNITFIEQVQCRRGIADIVTEHSIIEVKGRLSNGYIEPAITQLKKYQHYIDPSSKLYIVGCRYSRVTIDWNLIPDEITLIAYHFDNSFRTLKKGVK